jgi:hypothetical protein
MLLNTLELRRHIEKHLLKSSRCFCYSAFFTETAADWLVKQRIFKKDDRLLVRARPTDFLSGSCSIDALRKALDAGLTIKMSTALHAKIYAFDDFVYSGSANLTARGLALIENHNDEIGTRSELDKADLALLNNLWIQATHINNETLDKMQKFIAKNLETNKVLLEKQLVWPADIESEKRDIYCSDFPQDYPTDDIRWNSEELLKQTLAYQWLSKALIEQTEVSFGQLTSMLHDQVYDDPTPYRRKIKFLLANLISAVAELDSNSLEVIRPRHRQIVRKRMMFSEN